MKSTGIVRKMDELGRIVIPKEIRKNLNIGEGDALEIYVDGDVVLLKKYQPGCSCCGNIEDNLIKVGQVTLCKECLIKFTNEVWLMNFSQFKLFSLIEIKYGKTVLKDIINMTEDDIKANRIAFGKRTSSKEYMRIFKRSFKIWQRELKFS